MRTTWVAWVLLAACDAELADAPDASEAADDRRRLNLVIDLPRVSFGDAGTVIVRGGAPQRRVAIGFADPGYDDCFTTHTCLTIPLTDAATGGLCMTNRRGAATCSVLWPYSLIPGSTARAWQPGVRRSVSNIFYLDVPFCGDGVIDNNEQCDDWNNWDYDGCSSYCQYEYAQCGNGQVEFGEECDDGNWYDGDGCSSACQWAYYAVCGNGQLESYEGCDDGNNQDYDGCDQYCSPEVSYGYCGDGNTVYPEDCDDGNQQDGDGCTSGCMYGDTWYCGNGAVEGFEQCDDGNQDDTDGCDAYCNTVYIP